MTNDDDSPSDPPFHYEIWSGPGAAFGDEPKAIYYVENHNGQCGYGELALDFAIAAKHLMAAYREDALGNWTAPIAHLVRQTLELLLKDLLQTISEQDQAVPARPLRGHDLRALWVPSLAWLNTHHPDVREDARLDRTDHLLDAFHAIDPTGDLFRFGQSYQQAFNKRRSYDRVGIVLNTLEDEFNAAEDLLTHWTAVVRRKAYFLETGEEDTSFDTGDFPRRTPGSR